MSGRKLKMSRSRSQFITCNQCSQRGWTRSKNDSYQRTIHDSYPGHGLHNKRCQLVRPWRHRRQRAVKHGSADGVMVLSALHECWLQSYDTLLSSHRDKKFSRAGVVTCLKQPSQECFWVYVDGKNELLTWYSWLWPRIIDAIVSTRFESSSSPITLFAW